MKDVNAELISIGDELLIGQVINTNASWMAGELNNNGIKVIRITTVSDTSNDIKEAIAQAENRAEIILLTGGLGPTKDDITKHVLAEYFDSKMIFHEPTYKQVCAIFAARKFKVTDVNKKQAEIPEVCTPLFNQHGTAPGMWFEKKNMVLVSMPGVPFEMKALLKDQIIPRLQSKFKLSFIYHKTIMTTGLGESMLAEKIADWERKLPEYIRGKQSRKMAKSRKKQSRETIKKSKRELKDLRKRLTSLDKKISNILHQKSQLEDLKKKQGILSAQLSQL